jgi:hypothetical protein
MVEGLRDSNVADGDVAAICHLDGAECLQSTHVLGRANGRIVTVCHKKVSDFVEDLFPSFLRISYA